MLTESTASQKNRAKTFTIWSKNIFYERFSDKVTKISKLISNIFLFMCGSGVPVARNRHKKKSMKILRFTK
jgi:hypothetical protein